MHRNQQAIIIGAGPAGLTAAYELATRSTIRPIVLEMSDMLGGLARTVNYKGNRIDVGGHRFFSKSSRVLDWWLRMLPLEAGAQGAVPIAYEGKTAVACGPGAGPNPETSDRVMLVRSRKSRIYYLGKFFDYPIRLNFATIANLGPVRTARIGLSYAKARMLPIREEQNLEQFLINRFGRELYRTLFKSYTEKVWGVPCDQISAAWGAQRIKGLSISKALRHAVRGWFRRDADIAQKGLETSLIERFLYPKLGPGLMWETCAEEVTRRGGQIHKQLEVRRVLTEGNRVTGVVAEDIRTGHQQTFSGDYFFSTMPIRELVRGMSADVPDNVRAVAEGLVYRDFLIVGLLLEELEVGQRQGTQGRRIADNWIYIQEPEVRAGRLQVFNNWSPYMVADPSKTWIGVEYFCNQDDPLWRLPDADMANLAATELQTIGIIDRSKVLDWTVIHMPRTYPAYFGTYGRFQELRRWVDRFENLFLIGRNGMHRYNNQDHSMLTAMTAVDNILSGRKEKDNIWEVNTEQEYHEESSGEGETNRAPGAPVETIPSSSANRP